MWLITLLSGVTYLGYLARGIQAGDTGDVVSAAATFGVAHPPGYPLYTFLGWLFHFIPISTPAWRVGLLSVLPHALVVGFVYRIVYRLTKSNMSALFAAAVLFGNYIFFLYSVTAEVFALLDLFVVLCLWIALEIKDHPAGLPLYLLFLVGGLSLTHHQLILFMVPALVVYLYFNKSLVSIAWKKAVMYFTAGLIPYAYILLPPLGSSMIIWDAATTPQNVFKLITRGDYGTFQSALYFGQLPYQRWLNVVTFFHYFYIDFLWIGAVLAGIGFVWLWKYQRNVFRLLSLSVLSIGPVFFFYASFPIMNRFTLGTFERFLLPSYTMLSIIIGIGFYSVSQMLKKLFPSPVLTRVFVPGFCIILFLYPIRIASSTLPKFSGYSTDRTAENVAVDMLRPLPAGSILLVDRDTPLFTTEYARYVLQERTDVLVVHGSRINFPYYRQMLRRRYPTISEPTDMKKSPIQAFLELNSKQFRIFSYVQYPVNSKWSWFPYGLVYELIPADSPVNADAYIQRESAFWNSAHDPTKGILSRYTHLILSDVMDVYTSASYNYGKALLTMHKYREALEAFRKAIHFGGDADIANTYKYAGLSALALAECNTALQYFDDSGRVALSPDYDLLKYKAITYRDCLHDEARATQFFDEFAATQTKNQTQLQQL